MPNDTRQVIRRMLCEAEDPIPATLSRITQSLGCSPYEINNGLCDAWADAVMDAFPEAEIWETHWDESDINHQFIKLGDLFYDAESPRGVPDYMELSIFATQAKRRQPASPLSETEHPPGGRELSDAERALIAEFEFETTGPSPDPQSPDVVWQAYDAMPIEQLAEYVGPQGRYEWPVWFDIQYKNADRRGPERQAELDAILEGPIREPVVISEATKMDRLEFKLKGDYMLWDGTHRFAGSLKAGHRTIPVLLGVLP